jgi:hypothetical protein
LTHWGVRDEDVFVHSLGCSVSTLYAVKIFKTYGNDAISKVSGNLFGKMSSNHLEWRANSSQKKLYYNKYLFILLFK